MSYANAKGLHESDTPALKEMAATAGRPMWQIEGAEAADYEPAPTTNGPEVRRPGRVEPAAAPSGDPGAS